MDPDKIAEALADVDISSDFDKLKAMTSTESSEVAPAPIAEPTPDVTQNSSPETKTEDTVVEAPKPADPLVYKEPVRQDNESDGQFALRQRMASMVAKRSLSTSPEEKKDLTRQIKDLRKELPHAAGPQVGNEESHYQQNTQPTEPEPIDTSKMSEDEYERYIIALRAKEAGFISSDELAEKVDQILLQRDQMRIEEDTDKMYVDVVETFKNSHPEYKDETNLANLLTLVEDTYNYEGKSAMEIIGFLERAHEDMTGVSEHTAQRFIDETKKINTLDFSNSSSSTSSNNLSIDEVTTDFLKKRGETSADLDAATDAVAAKLLNRR